MDSLIILIPIALIFTGVAVAAFFWAVNSGQYEDLDRSARDILFDDEPDNDIGDAGENKDDKKTGERHH